MLEPLPPGRGGYIGPFQLLARLGAGGMGEVYLARRHAAGAQEPELAAVKTIRQDAGADEEFRVRFRREVEAARAVTDPRTASVLDAEVRAARPWLATEYVPGPTLADAVRSCGPLPYDAVRMLGAELVGALGSIHAARVLHRDLKPGNVLLAAGGPRVIDFGIARAFDATALTATGMVVGTPGFMSPEQVTGAQVIGPASDVFSLGSVLCFAATGHGPFEDEEAAAVIFRIARADADLTGVPDPLREIIAACLRRDPDERTDVGTLAALLGADSPVAAPDSAYPWPPRLAKLITGYERTAAGIAAATPVPPPHRRAAVTRRAAPAPKPRRASAQWALAAVAAVAAVVTVVLLATLLAGDEGGAGGGGAGAGSGGGNGGEGSAADGAQKDGPPVVTDGGAAVRTGDFGDDALRPERRPTGWSPWNASLPRVNGCALGGRVLVCTTSEGGAVGLDASDGTEMWTAPGSRENEDTAMYPPPAVEGGVAYLPHHDGVTAVELQSGESLWDEPGSGGQVQGLAVLDGVLVMSQPAPKGMSAVTALGTAGDRKELWSFEDERVFSISAVDGRAYLTHALAPSDPSAGYAADVSAVGLRSGGRTGRARCRDFAVRDTWAVCWEPPDLTGETGVTVRTADTLKKLRTIAPDVPVHTPPVLDDDGAILLHHDGRLTRYDLASGERLWDRRGITDSQPEAVLQAGGRLLAYQNVTVYATPAGDPDGVVTSRSFAVEFKESGPEDVTLPVTVLVSGGAVFMVYNDGTALSGYLPT